MSVENNKERILKGLIKGVDQGWWPSFNETTLDPHPFPWHFSLFSKELRREIWHSADSGGFTSWHLIGTFNFQFFSQLLHQIGMFDSVNQARKAGHDNEIISGDFWFKKRTIHILIDNEE